MQFPVARLAALVTAGFVLAGCGAHPLVGPAAPRAAATAKAQGVPPTSAFVTVTGKVTKLLPDTHNQHNGLDHQNFVIVTDAGETLAVNNDDTAGVGTKVPNLQVGEALIIRGVEYHDPGQSGIHWTHHNVQPNDAGFIRTPDGATYQ